MRTLVVLSCYLVWCLFNLTVIIRDSAFSVQDGGNFVLVWFNFAFDYLLLERINDRLKRLYLFIGCKVVGLVLLIVWQLQFPVLLDELTVQIVYYVSVGMFGLGQLGVSRSCWIKYKQLSASIECMQLDELQLASDAPMEGL